MAYGASETHDALWKQILEHHWKYVESEESMLKIELRRDLEDLIEKRLGKVPPNEKFYLDDTRYAFDSSVAHLDDFSAYKASIGFEAISQYANNLFVKPWRKEYKVIKMYSGFYQHEIAANLVNAEKLFQAMGYQLMPNKTLILDGPICPDQVMNVARDAITAYVECQMMKRIYSELTPLRLSIDWIDIYNFRSYHAADVMQTVKQMALSIQEKHHKKQQAKLRGSGRYPPLQYAGTTNFPMGIPGPGPMFMNGGGQLKHHQNGLVDGCGSYRHPAMNLAYPGYRGPNGMMAAPPSYCQPVDSSIYGGAPMSSVAATQTAAYGTPLVPAQPAASILSGKKKGYDDYDMMSSMRRGTDTLRSGSGCAKKLDRYHKNAELLIDYESDMLPEALAERNQKEQQQQQQQPHHHHHHYLHHQTSRNSRQSDFDSYEDEQLQREQEQSSNVSRRISSKNQDGIGCYETWNYVYQNLEKQGYSKDLGERGDFLTDELDADDNHLIGTAAEEDDLRRRRRNDLMTDDHHDHHHHHHSGRRESGNASSSATLRRNHNEKLKAMKPKAADKVDGIVRQASAGLSSTKQPMAEGRRHERHPSTGSGVTATTMLVQKAAKMSLSNNATNDDLLLGSFEQNGASKGEPPAAGSSRRNSVTKKQITPQGSGSSSSTGLPAKETNKTHSSTSTGILVNNHHHSHSANSSGSAYPSHSGAPAQGKKKTATFDTGAVTIINPSPTGSGSPSGSGAPAGAEWNCNFCTYLNPDVKRICDMCSKSRDFRLDGTTTASNGTTATCV
ncbi:protein tamozhennic isoform X2 [Anopheles gambiae]|uniref:protein tamozhennic isoform X2 n=1 Tax=Anopheles gambiae TaxID=7165 RepID=UPI002AC8A1D6|nr:protein tamozhennic isoform X2 [Anopheles gambiae]